MTDKPFLLRVLGNLFLTKFRRNLLAYCLFMWVFLVMPSGAFSWPTNHLDSSAVGNKPYCTSCHSYKTGYVDLEKVNGIIPFSNTVTVNKNAAFTLEYRAIGLGYGRFTVSGAVQLPNTTKWVLSAKPGGDVPWSIAQQDTNKGAPAESPYIWATAFAESLTAAAQKGVTLDDGTAPPALYLDRNRIAHDELFTSSVFVSDSVPYGSYTLKLWGIGTASNGALAYCEKSISVVVTDDTTPPTAPGNPTFSAVTPSAVTLGWTASTDGGTGVKGYEIYRSTSATGPFEYIGYSSAPTNAYIDQDLLANTGYYYKLAAVDNAGNIAWGDSSSVTTQNGVRTDAISPAVPLGLSAFITNNPLDPTKNIVKLTWNANVEGDTVSYMIYRATSASGPYAALNSEPVTAVTETQLDATEKIVLKTGYYLDSQIRYGTTYYYRIEAVDIVGKLSGPTGDVAATPAVDAGSSNPHGNYKSKNGMCQNCHSIHTSSGKELIFNASITDSCYTCHDGSQSKYNAKADYDPLFNPSHHKIPEGRYACDACHNPHYNSVTNPKLLAARSLEDNTIKHSGNEVCWACHGTDSNLQNPFGRDHHTAFAASKHNTLIPGTEAQIVCLNCHQPHGSRDYPLLVSANSDNFCITCHKNQGFNQTKVFSDPSEGSVFTEVYVTNFSNLYLGTQHDENFYDRNTCAMCHEPHGSNTNRHMLKYPYKDYYRTTTVEGKVYGPVDYSNNAEADMICFRCHDSQYYVGVDGDYTQITNGSKFGNGNAKNYHYLSGKLKVSCRVCHDPHSGQSAYQDLSKPAGFTWNLNNDLYINFDWAKQVGVLAPSVYNNRLAFIPAYDANFNVNQYSCALTCHGKDHTLGAGKFLSYARTSSSPAVKCIGCHDVTVFDTNSRHPILGPISPGGNSIDCEQCHLADHTLHNKTNPYGLQDTIVTNWVYGGTQTQITTTLPTTNDPTTGKAIPSYKDFCWACHGSTPGRNLLGDHKTNFVDKPHALLQRDRSANPYGQGLDIACLKCHYNHASSNMRLLRNVIDGVAIDAESSTGKINACMACHDGSPAKMDIASKYNAPSSAGHFIKADPTKKMLCTECHDSHGSTNKMYLLDTANKYNTGITFEGNHNGAGSRWFCLSCHPLWGDVDRPTVEYNTAGTVGAGVISIKQLPPTVQDHILGSGTARECSICHDPHKPWPATGGEDKCFDCHSRPNGEATDIKSLTGLTTQPGTGLVSHHPIGDGTTVNNTCMTNCHKAHPHDKRAEHLKADAEKDLCLGCHDAAVTPAKSPYSIDSAKYNANPHNYDKVIRVYPADDSTFLGNCDKCHMPHGSNFKPLLRKRKDELCVGCHNGVETDGNGKVIKDIKTLYEKMGHQYKEFPTAKMYCDECHIPHGSTNDNYLRDSEQMAPRQTITLVTNGVQVSQKFPDNLIGGGYNMRVFCTTCHKEYAGESVSTWVYYKSETTPGGQVKIANIPLVGDHGVTINEHRAGDPKPCTECHNPHDRDPVGNDEGCFVCHGASGYATQIEPLTGLNGAWPNGTPKTSYHPIKDDGTAGTNDCMNMCHTKHVHNPRANLIKDKRKDANDITAPVGPVLEATASSANQIDVKVSAPANTDVLGYNIFRSTDNVTWSKYAVVNSRIIAPAYFWFYDGGLPNNQTRYYKAQAFDRKGNTSADSAVVSATTDIAADTTSPEIPLNLAAQKPTKLEMQSNSLVINWSPSKDNYELRKYNIYRAAATPENLGAYALIGSTGTTSFTDGSLAPKKTYYYRVTAVDAAGNESAKTAWVNAITSADTATVKAGYNYYRDGSEQLIMHTYRPEDASLTPTNTFMNGAQIRIKVTVPEGYFGTLAEAGDQKQAYLTTYPESRTGQISLGVVAKQTAGGKDTYTWTSQVPSTASLYQLTVQLEKSGGKKFLNKEIIYVVPTNKYMKTYTDAARTIESLVFKPGDTVYLTAPSDNPTWGYTSAATSLYAFDGSVKANGVAPQLANYSSLTGLVKFQLALPAGGLTNDCWYYIGAYGSNTWNGTRIIDINQQILVRTPDVTVPTAPSSVTVTTKSINKVSLSWTGSTDNVSVTGYNIYRKKAAEGSYVLAGTTSADNLSYEVSGLEPGSDYNFKVRAIDPVGNLSGDSNIVTTTTTAEVADSEAPNPPEEVKLVVNSASAITINWAANSPLEKVTTYSVYRSIDTINYYRVTSTGTNSYTDTGLVDNTPYYYKVVAQDKYGNTSAFSVSATRTTKSSGENSLEGGLCMSCHDGVSTPPVEYTVTKKIGTAYNLSKHNVDYDIMTFKDGSVYRGNCTKCHVPHGSDYLNLLRQADGVDLCFLCHESASESGMYSGKRDYLQSSHGLTTPQGEYSSTPRYWPGGTGADSTLLARKPEDAGKCFNCHAPHGRYDPLTGEYIKSSAWTGNGSNLNNLCFTCHSDDTGTFYGEWYGKTVYSTTSHGDPAKNAKMKLANSLGDEWGSGECANCHDPHGTQYPSMLRMPVNVDGTRKNELCLGCHDKEAIRADTELYDGSAVYKNSKHGMKAQWVSAYNTGGNMYNKTSFLPGVCLNCHNSHGKTPDKSADPAKVINKMLVIEDGPNNEICNKCHEDTAIQALQPGYDGNALYQLGAHKGVDRPGALWPGGKYYPDPSPAATRGKCINCHDPHGTAKTDWYGNIININGATFDEEEELCYSCHKAGVVAPEFDLAQFKGKYTGHMPWMTTNVHTFGEDLNSKPRHVECQDCHNTHSVESTYGIASLDQRLPKALKGTEGIKITSWPQPKTPNITDNGADGWLNNKLVTDPAQYPYQVVDSGDPAFEEYMLCFKCHASYGTQSGGKRVIAYMNPKNMSSHGFNPYVKNPTNFMNKALSYTVGGVPVADSMFTPGTPFNPNPDINVKGEARRYKITCSDCHGNGDVNGPKGPHGSNYDYLLKNDPKTINFCLDCHYTKAYSAIDVNYAQYSFGYPYGHNHYSMAPSWQYKKADNTWTSDPTLAANPAAVDYVAKVNNLFGTNYCRKCHYAGAFVGDTDNVSVHGENASSRTQISYYGTPTYGVRRGMNGYGMITTITGDASQGCSTTFNDLGVKSCSFH